MIPIKTIKIGILGDDGYKRELRLDEFGRPIYYFGLAKDFEQDMVFKIIDKDQSAQEIIDDVDEWRHVPWD